MSGKGRRRSADAWTPTWDCSSGRCADCSKPGVRNSWKGDVDFVTDAILNPSLPSALRPMPAILEISGLAKTYATGTHALKPVNLAIERGEIFALLGPNGAGKTTLISIVCGIVTASAGTVRVAGHDIVRDYRAARAAIGLVPQELATDMFETPWATANFSRGLFGLPPDPALVESVLKDLSLWSKRNDR